MIESDKERLDFDSVPQSKGVPSGLVILAMIGIIAIFAIGAYTTFNAPYGHTWPAPQTQRIPLGDSGN